jgi:heme O synthase-like polyprenyltransferase
MFPIAIIIGVLTIGALAGYTYIKRRTAVSAILSSMINGIAVPSFAWFASIGHVDDRAFIIMTLLTFWTLNHLTTIAMSHADEYEVIERPTIPRHFGRRKSTFLAFISSAVAVAMSLLLLRASEHLGPLYISLVALTSLIALGSNAMLLKSPSMENAKKAYRASRVFIAIFFLGLVLDSFFN